jgi:hypothetical protein
MLFGIPVMDALYDEDDISFDDLDTYDEPLFGFC